MGFELNDLSSIKMDIDRSIRKERKKVVSLRIL